MTRGKYAARAATRRYETDMATTTETYQRQIVKLAAERDDLKANLAQEQQERAEERRMLKAMLAEGVSPELAARDRLIESLREELGEERRHRSNFMRAGRELRRLLIEQLTAHGQSGSDAERLIIAATPMVRWDAVRMQDFEHAVTCDCGCRRLVSQLARKRSNRED